MVKTLLVDGSNLMKIGFHGVKDLYSDGSHLGAIYHFINTIRKFLEEHNHVHSFEDTPPSGRPTVRYYINPRLLDASK